MKKTWKQMINSVVIFTMNKDRLPEGAMAGKSIKQIFEN